MRYFINENVLRLQVKMVNPLLVQVVDAQEQLFHDVLGLRLGEYLLLHDICECAPGDVLSHDVLIRAILKQVEDTDRVRVVNAF